MYKPDHPNAAVVMEHVIVMSQSLGRPLSKGENVHHKSGDRADNRLTKGHEFGGCPSTCCNLELWSTAQPAGQRIPDKIEYAKSILAVYSEVGRPGDLWQESW